MAATLVQQECFSCTGHVHHHDRTVGYGPTLGLTGLPGHYHLGATNLSSGYGLNTLASLPIAPSGHHNFTTSTVVSTPSPNRVSSGAGVDGHLSIEVVEPRTLPFEDEHTEHTTAFYRRETIPELNPLHIVVENGIAHLDVTSKASAVPLKGINSWTLCLPIPIPANLANATLESVAYTVRYASLNAGSASVQTDIVLWNGHEIPQGIVTDYSQLPLYRQHDASVGEKSGQGKGYGPPILKDTLGLLSSVPAFKNGGAAGAWSHYLDHQKVFPNIKIREDSSDGEGDEGDAPCLLYLFFHVYEYPGLEALRSISVDAVATWNDGAELERLKEERARELKEFREEKEKLIMMKREVELTIEESKKRAEDLIAMEKELEERQKQFLAAEQTAKAEHDRRMREINDAEIYFKGEYEKRKKEVEDAQERFRQEVAKAKVSSVPSISAAPDVADEQMQDHIAERAKELGQVCGAGYKWNKEADGYRCAGKGHFISFKDLGMQ